MLKWLTAHKFNQIDLFACSLAAAWWVAFGWQWGLVAALVGTTVSVLAERFAQ
jgi:hypothetical protein